MKKEQRCVQIILVQCPKSAPRQLTLFKWINMSLSRAEEKEQNFRRRHKDHLNV